MSGLEPSYEELRQRLADAKAKLAALGVTGPEQPPSFPSSVLIERDLVLSQVEALAGIGSFVWYLDDDSVRWSENSLSLAADTPETAVESITEAVLLRVHPDDQERVRGHAEAIAATSASQDLTFRLKRSDGQLRLVHASLSIVLETPRRVCVGVLQDITEREAAQQALRTSEKRLRRAERVARIGNWERDLANEHLTWSDEVYRLFGYTPGEVTPSYELCREHCHPEDCERWIQYLHRTYRNGDRIELEYRIMNHAGEVVWLRNEAVVERDVNGTPVKSYGTVQDITAYRNTLSRLEESETKYRALFEQAPDAVTLFDASTGGFLEFNALAHEMTGYTREEYAQLCIHDLEANESPEETRAHIASVIRGGRESFETRHRTKDGRTLEILVNTRHVNIDGCDAFINIWTDITARRRIEEQLRQSEARNRALLEAIPDLMFLLSRDGTILDFQANDANDLVLEPHEVVGGKIQDTFPPEEAERALCSIRDALATGVMQTCEYRLPVRRGLRYFEARMVVAGDDQVLAIVRNVTEERETQEKLRESLTNLELAASATNVGFWDLDIRRGDGHVSDPWARMLGYEVAELEPLDDNTWSRLCHPDDRPDCDAALQRCLSGEAEWYESEFRMRHRDGSWHWILGRAKVIKRSPEGEPLMVAGVNLDVTQLRQAEQEALHSGERFRELFDNIASGVAVYEAVNDGEDFVFVDVNPAGVRLRGLDRAEHLGRSVQEIYPGVHEMGMFEVLQNVWHTGEACHFGLSHYEDDSVTLWAENYVCKLPNGEIVAVYEDVTEQKRARDREAAALAETQRHSRQVEAMLKAAELVLVEPDFEVAARSIFDRCTQLIGATSGYVAMLSPDGAENEVLFLESGGLPCDVDPELPMPIRGLRADSYRLKKAVFENDFHHSPWREFMPSGHVRLENVMFAPLILRGDAVGLLGMANKPGGFTQEDAAVATAFANIAALALHRVRSDEALRESEQRLRAMMDANRDAVALVKPDGTIVDMNLTCASRFGKTVEDVVGTKVGDLFPDDVAERRRELIRQVCETGESLHVTDEREGRWNENVLYPVKDASGAVVNIAVFARDITEQLRAQRDYEMLFNGMVEGFALHEMLFDDNNHPADYRFLAVNPAFERMTGLRAQDILGRTVLGVFPDTEPAWVHKYGQVALTGKPEHFEQYAGALNKYFSVSAYRPVAGQFACVFSDITQQRVAQTRLQLESEILELLNRPASETDTIREILWRIKETTGFEAVGLRLKDGEDYPYFEAQGFARDFLRTENSLCTTGPDGDACLGEDGKAELACMCGRVIRGGMRGRAPYFTEAGSFWTNSTTELLANATPEALGGDTRNRCPQEGYESIALIPLQAEGENIGLLQLNDKRPNRLDLDTVHYFESLAASIGISVTRQRDQEAIRENEERLQQMLDSVGVGVFVVRAWDRRLVYVNPAAAALVGTPREYLTGRLCHDVICSADDGNCPASGNGAGTGPEEHELLASDGRRIPVLKTVSRVSLGAQECFLESFVDLSALKQAEESRNRLESQIRQSQKLEAVGTLAGGIAHDFNNILGAIVGYAELIESDAGPDAPSHDFADQILIASRRAQDLVTQILTFTRQGETEIRPVSFRLIVKEALKMLRATIPANVAIEEHICEMPCVAQADPTQLHQVVVNLCTNAYQSLPPDGGTISVALTMQHGDTAMVNRFPDMDLRAPVRLEVKDNGCGMTPEVRERIFDPFFSTKPVGKGTGLGLSTVHGIVTSLKGGIEVASESGRGSTFTVYLPPAEGRPQDVTADSPSAPRGAGRRILVVDDEEAIGELLRLMLQRAGHRATLCSQPEDALERITATPDDFDLVISDYAMPGMTGLNMVRRIREEGCSSPVILMTGYSDTLTEQNAKELGVMKILLKPLRRKVLYAALEEVWECLEKRDRAGA